MKHVKATCEKIQNVGSLKDEAGINTIETEEALSLMETLLPQVNKEYGEAKEYLTNFYGTQDKDTKEDD